MARKSAAAQTREPKDSPLPEVLVSPTDAPVSQRAAYWLDLLQKPEELRAAITADEFFRMIAQFPEAFWDRFSIYLYRRPVDDLMVKNPPRSAASTKRGNYLPGGVFHQAIDEEFVARRYGGGKYTAYLKLDNDETVKEHTFSIDGPPKVLPGQTVEIDGKPVQVSGAQPSASAQPTDQTDIARVIDASSKANESNMELLVHGTKAVIDMVKENSTQPVAAAQNPVEQLVQLATAIKALTPPPAVPQPDPLRDKLMEILLARFAAPQDAAEPQTPISETLATVRELKEVLPELLGKATKAAADSTPVWVTPLIQIGQTLIGQLPAIMAQAARNRALEFERMVFLRNAKPNDPIPPKLLTEAAPAQPAAPTLTQSQPMDPQSVVTGIVTMICNGFDHNPKQGYETAAAIAYAYADPIESLGFSKTLGSAAEVDKFVASLPVLQQRSTDARWAMFREDFLNYTTDRWGDEEGEEEPASNAAPAKPGPVPAA
jgi:hypothetical protein